ncbi:Sugar phosphatase YidA [Sporomusa silvacetica DSM 10669]|uniref:Sugar phosphatase YidA n=1 Tax=Sporomusa silvacetica DSM 10669 TaxID=1123289 RepID=A0ABZ3IPW0_9FIRM|nr:Cof-type HAD-IIB family hydrolase [Sporomusa silvacetica]OZC16274.1 sugar phosphatase YidA [Sporomusa silvacetica DSM 10669]
MQALKKAGIKLMVFDLDDTLLNNNISISQRTQQAIRQAMNQGIKVTLATGRMYCSTILFARKLELKMPLITYNGAMINDYPSGKVLFHSPINPQAATQVLQLCQQRQWYIQSYINDELYVRELNKQAKLYAEITGAKPIPVGEQLYTMRGAPTKMLAIAEPTKIRQMLEVFQSRLGKNTLSIAESKPNYLEITNPAVNKGIALKFIADRLHIDQREIMAVGNGHNDIPMLSYAGFGVAVGNAPLTVKSAARLVTGTNDDDGVADIIEKYILSC